MADEVPLSPAPGADVFAIDDGPCKRLWNFMWGRLELMILRYYPGYPLLCSKERINKFCKINSMLNSRSCILEFLVCLTNYMELSPFWETACCAATQDFPSTLWNPTVHYRVHKSPSPVPVLCQINPDHTTPTDPSKIDLNIITHPLTSWPSK